MRAESGPSIGERAGLRTRGHAVAGTAIQRAIQRGRPPHALLISGPAGVGKTTLALDLAAGLLCLAPDPAARPCRACIACRKVDHGNHPDLHRLAPEGAGAQVRLAQVQALQGDLALMPMEGRTRVAIIEAAHRLNPDAQNALLKTLEEPVGEACLVLCADDISTLLPTVHSRCARLRLGVLSTAAIADLLLERGVADSATARTLAAMAGGLPGRAIALAEHTDALPVRDRVLRRLLDLLAADRRTRLAAAAELLTDAATLDVAMRGAESVAGRVASDDGEPARSARRPLPAERRRAAQRLLAIWRDLARDLAVAAWGGRRELHVMGLLEELERAAAGVDLDALLRFLDRLDGLDAAIDAYANPELAVDDLLLGWRFSARAA